MEEKKDEIVVGAVEEAQTLFESDKGNRNSFNILFRQTFKIDLQELHTISRMYLDI